MAAAACSGSPLHGSAVPVSKILLLIGIVLAGCGGSASETPFPLEPDRAALRAPVASSAPASSAAPFDPADVDDDSIIEQEGPAATTWGGKPTRRKAPVVPKLKE